MARFAQDTAPVSSDISYDNGSSGLSASDAQGAIDELASEKADATRTINPQTGTSYTLVLGDAGAIVTLDNASAITLTVPPNSSVAYPVGTQVELIQLGAGQVTVAEGSGVTVADGTTLSITAQHKGAVLTKLATNTWALIGALEA